VTEREIICLNFRQQYPGELPKILIVMLIAHRFKKLHRDLRATEVVIQVGDKGLGHGTDLRQMAN
jgi:hypothetical protein